MKKIVSGLMALGLLAMNAVPALAATAIADVSQNYWAKKEIVEVVDENIMCLTGNRFNPEGNMTRIEFVNALLKVLSNDNLNVNITNKFSDVSKDTPNYDNILRSQQLGLVYGYPDGTFQPNRVVLRSEAQSVISHITKDMNPDTAVLEQFKDAAAIPAWAKKVYAKTINYGIYVNYPDSRELRPNDNLSRAEAAVLLARLKAKLDLVKQEYIGTTTIEHLNVTKKAPSNEVKVNNIQSVITEGNVLAVAFESKFKSEEHKAGDIVYFVNDENIVTKEGTVVIPAGSKFIAKINEIKDPKLFNKNARVYPQLTKIVLPDGKELAFNAKPFSKDYSLKEGPWMTTGKLLLCTATGGAVGIGAGVGFAFIPDPTKIGTGIAIGAPVGAAVGLVTGLVTPGLEYHAKAGEEVYVILLDEASIPKANVAL
ncbi:MAG: S-layer homology domain-containing protein [Candidatus Gastranaerophilaceae bacterium]|nr:s-layer domain-containing protein [Clostridium sp. CAG:967]